MERRHPLEVKPLSSNARFKQSRYDIFNPHPLKSYYVASSGGGKSSAAISAIMAPGLPHAPLVPRTCTRKVHGEKPPPIANICSIHLPAWGLINHKHVIEIQLNMRHLRTSQSPLFAERSNPGRAPSNPRPIF